MTIRGRINIYQGPYFYIIKSQDLPLDVPLVDDALPLEGYFGPIPVDAAESFTIDQTLVIMKFGNEFVFIGLNKTRGNHLMSDIFAGLPSSIYQLDAVWFNTKSMEMILFEGNFIWSFSIRLNGTTIRGTLLGQKRNIDKELKGIPSDIDGVLSLRGMAYIFKGSYFWAVNESNWSNTSTGISPYTPYFAWDLFDTETGCNYTEADVDRLKLEIQLYEGFPSPSILPPTVSSTPPPTVASTTIKATQNNFVLQIVLFSAALIIITLVLILILLAIYLRKRPQEPVNLSTFGRRTEDPISQTLSQSTSVNSIN
jgi:hypothetical protein